MNGPSLNVHEILDHRKDRLKYLGQKYFGLKVSTNNDKILKVELAKRERGNFFEERKKKIIENNIFNHAKTNIFKSNSELSTKNLPHFNLYLNKGVDFNKENHKDIETQTEEVEIRSKDSNDDDINIIISQNSDMIYQSTTRIHATLHNLSNNIKFEDIEQITKNLKDKLDIFEKFIYNPEETLAQRKYLTKNMKNIKDLLDKFAENSSFLSYEITDLIEHCDVIMNKNDDIKEQLKEIQDMQRCMVESYQDLSNTYNKAILHSKNKIENFLNNKKINDSNIVTNFLKEIADSYHEIICEDKELKERLAPSTKISYGGVRRRSIRFASKKEKTIDLTKFDFKKLESNLNEELILESHKLISEYMKSNMIINSTLSKKEMLKIIDHIYFHSLSKTYIRNKESWYDDPFLEPSELPYNYFISVYGIEKLSKRKFVEFLHSCFSSFNDGKRILIFVKYFFKCSIKKFQFDKKYNHNFIQKNIILFIQSLKELDKIERTILYSEDVEYSYVYIVNNKIQDLFNKILEKYPISSYFKEKINKFFKENLINFKKNLKSFKVYDFDNLLILFCDVLDEIKLKLEDYFSNIFKALNIEKKVGKVDLLDFVISYTVIFNQKTDSLDEVKYLFDKFRLDDSLTDIQFKYFIFNNNMFDIRHYSNFLGLDNNDIFEVFGKLNDEVVLNSSIIDLFTRRINVLKDNPFSKNFLKKINVFSTRIQSMKESKDIKEMQIIWLSFRILDTVTFELYNDFRLHNICYPILDIINDFSKLFNENLKRSLLTLYLVSKDKE